MSRRQDIQTAEGVALDSRGYGVVEKCDKVAPTNGVVGYAPGAAWFNLAASASPLRYTNIGGNGFGSNATALWLADDPGSGGQFQLGGQQGAGTGGTGGIPSFMKGSGYIYRNAYAAGSSPASTGSDIVVDFYAMPANTLNVAFNELNITAGGKVVGSDATTAKLIFNCAAPTIGSAVSGGTTIATTGSMSSAGEGWVIMGIVIATAAGAQIYQETSTAAGTTHGGVGVPAAISATSTGIIYIAVTMNVTTTATDGTLWWWNVQGFN